MPIHPETGLSAPAMLQRRAILHPEATAITYLKTDDVQERLTYGNLDRQARGIAAWLLTNGCKGQRAILIYPAGLDFIAAFFGCLYACVTPVPCVSRLRPRNTQTLGAIAANCEATLALTDSHTLQQLVDSAATRRGLRWVASDTIAPADNADRFPDVDVGDLAFLQYTSGSTAFPRGVRVSHRNLSHHLGALAASYRINHEDVFISWLPHFHDMGLVGKLLLSIHVGAHCVIFSPLQFMQRPARWLRAITDFRGTASAAPNFAFELCLNKIDEAERETFDLSSWRAALNGAEPVRADTHRRFQNVFSRNGLRPEVLCPCYGLAEATLMVTSSRPWHRAKVLSFARRSLSGPRPTPGPDAGGESVALVGCGPPAEGVSVAIVDRRNNEPVAPGTIGEIWVKGDSVATGYFNSPEATAGAFGARLANGEQPYLRTGDLGFFHDGELFIAGRLKDLIIIHGRNLHPHDIERAAQEGRPDLIAGRGAAFGVDIRGEERLVLVQELRHRDEASGGALIAQIRAAIAREFEIQPGAIFLVASGSLPLTSSGKLARHRARDLLLKGEVSPVASWCAADCPEMDRLQSNDIRSSST
jgi:acyl-CoA synthetase (AMP-forming)/AMP-acid ligase II